MMCDHAIDRAILSFNLVLSFCTVCHARGEKGLSSVMYPSMPADIAARLTWLRAARASSYDLIWPLRDVQAHLRADLARYEFQARIRIGPWCPPVSSPCIPIHYPLSPSKTCLQVGKGVNIVSSAATYGREQAGRVVGEDAMKPVDSAAERARGAYSASVDTIKSEGVFGAVKTGFSKSYSFAQSVGSSAKSHLTDANTTVKEKLEKAQSAAYKNYIVPTGAAPRQLALQVSVALCDHAWTVAAVGSFPKHGQRRASLAISGCIFACKVTAFHAL